MCVCMRVCVCSLRTPSVCVCVCVCVCLNACVHVYMCVYMCICVCGRVCACICIFAHPPARAHTHTQVVCAENSEGDIAAAVAAAGGREERVAVSHGSFWDASSLTKLEREAAAGGFTVVCVDLSMCGHTLVADGHALLKMLQSLFEATLHTVLVKSKALERHARAWHNSHSLMQAGLPRHHICEDVQIVCAEGVTDYRATIPRVLAAGDRVLEIG